METKFWTVWKREFGLRASAWTLLYKYSFMLSCWITTFTSTRKKTRRYVFDREISITLMNDKSYGCAGYPETILYPARFQLSDRITGYECYPVG